MSESKGSPMVQGRLERLSQCLGANGKSIAGRGTQTLELWPGLVGMSVQRFAEPEHAHGKERDAERREGKHLRPEHAQAHALEERPAYDNEIVSHRVDMREPLHEDGHGEDREAEAGQDEGRVDD